MVTTMAMVYALKRQAQTLLFWRLNVVLALGWIDACSPSILSFGALDYGTSFVRTGFEVGAKEQIVMSLFIRCFVNLGCMQATCWSL